MNDAVPSVYHPSCHMLRELGIEDAPEDLVNAMGIDRRVPDGQGRCCGFGGMFSVMFPEVSTAMADDVLDAVVAVGARRVIGCDPTCLLHLRARALRRGLDLAFRHLATLADEATSAVHP